MPVFYRTRNGQHQALFGGYVSWDSRTKDEFGYPLRIRKELRVWLRSNLADDDCGPGTDELVAALKAKAGANKQNVEVSESWRY